MPRRRGSSGLRSGTLPRLEWACLRGGSLLLGRGRWCCPSGGCVSGAFFLFRFEDHVDRHRRRVDVDMDVINLPASRRNTNRHCMRRYPLAQK
jgi:hypothetical protein